MAIDVGEVLSGVRDAASVRRVFGDPYERDGVTVIPVARVRGAGGGGQGQSPGGEDGGGLGYGLSATGAGVYVIRDGQVSWEPALDVTRIALAGQAVALVGLLVLRSILRSRRRRRPLETSFLAGVRPPL